MVRYHERKFSLLLIILYHLQYHHVRENYWRFVKWKEYKHNFTTCHLSSCQYIFQRPCQYDSLHVKWKYKRQIRCCYLIIFCLFLFQSYFTDNLFKFFDLKKYKTLYNVWWLHYQIVDYILWGCNSNYFAVWYHRKYIHSIHSTEV